MPHAMHHPCTDPFTAQLAHQPQPQSLPPNLGVFRLHDTATELIGHTSCYWVLDLLCVKGDNHFLFLKDCIKKQQIEE